MNNNYTHIALVIDRSGSMSAGWQDVVGGYKQLVADNKAQSDKCTFTVVAFDDAFEVLEDFTDVKDVKDELTIKPRGWTALLDAVGKTINMVGESLSKLEEKERPGKTILMVQTDGEENSSKEFTKEQIKKMIAEQTEKYSWVFMFLGASLDSVQEAKSWGIDSSRTMVYDSNDYGTTLDMVSTKLCATRSASTKEEYAAATIWDKNS